MPYIVHNMNSLKNTSFGGTKLDRDVKLGSELYHFSPCCHFSLSIITFHDKVQQKKLKCKSCSSC